MPVNQFLIDNVNGAKEAVQYLIDRGHTRIAHVMGNPNKKVVLERFSGYTEAMQSNGLLIREDYIQKNQGGFHHITHTFQKNDERTVTGTSHRYFLQQ